MQAPHSFLPTLLHPASDLVIVRPLPLLIFKFTTTSKKRYRHIPNPYTTKNSRLEIRKAIQDVFQLQQRRRARRQARRPLQSRQQERAGAQGESRGPQELRLFM